GGNAALTPSWLGGKGNDATVFSAVRPGPYEPSTLAIGEDKDIARHRGDGLGFVRLAAVERYLNGERARLIAATGKTRVPGRVMILASSGFLAFSTPDGNVYMAMGLLESLESADEVAAVLAHEVSHVLLKHHTADVIGDMQKKGQAVYEMGIGAKTMLSGRSTVAKGDAKTLQQVQLATDATDKVVLPAWGRGQEREADLLGVDLLAETGQSPPAMISMLEKLGAWEKANAEMEQAFWDRLTQASQRNVNEAVGIAYEKLLSTVSVNHPKTEDRITEAAQYFERHYGSRALVEPRSAPWTTVRNRPEVALVMRNYKQAFLAKKLLDQGRAQDAYAAARTSITGPTATDAYPNWVLARSAFALGRSREGLEALRRAVTSSEPVPNVYEDLIVAYEGAGSFSAALQWTDQASKAFGGSPRFMPHRIRLLRKTGRVAEAGTATADCSLNATDWKRLCQEANATPAGRAQR
ncbi:MAG: M48 family metalloprotease, partial [Candidatus Rokuibacteriota bacterium]